MKSEATSNKLSQVVSNNDHIRGPLDAPITLVEYGDYECRYCQAVHPIIQDLRERMGDQMRYVFRHFPLTTVHPYARGAAEAAEAVGVQGHFWEMHDALLANHGNLGEEYLISIAGQLKLDHERFERELREHVHADRIREDFRSGRQSGVNGTPTFFINGVRYDGAWDFESLLEAIEKPMGVRIGLLAQNFMRIAAAGGILLLITTVLVLLWANSPWAESYFHLLETNLALNLGSLSLSEHLLEWVNDGLMVIFFFVVGLEIKREITIGELASRKKATLPIAGALGGILVPVLLYVFFNAGGPGARGWGTPMATDIAFTLGILALLGRRAPLSLKVFFTALAIADDLSGVIVLALFYTTSISWVSLGIGGVFLVALIALNRAKVYSPLPYWLLGLGLWLAMLQSGVHPTIAGVLLATTIPTRSPPNTRALMAQAISVISGFRHPEGWRASDDDEQHQSVVQTFETITDRLQSPAQRLERDLQPWSAYLILPLFALANAGVRLGGESSTSLLTPVSMGVIFGLVIGKPLGISMFSWLAVRLGLAEMPSEVNWPQFFSATFLAGVGFTMSIFIANAAFDDPALLAEAKVAILVASVVAGLLGWTLLSIFSPNFDQTTASEPAAETATATA